MAHVSEARHQRQTSRRWKIRDTVFCSPLRLGHPLYFSSSVRVSILLSLAPRWFSRPPLIFATQRMLASPLVPSINFSSKHASDDYRPAKDLDAFNKLLPPPVEFVEGSSSGAYAVPEGKYKPINIAPPSPKTPGRPDVSTSLSRPCSNSQ